MEIIFKQDEKDNFISAINFLIHEVEACIQRNVLTQHGKVSVKGTSQKDINIKLDFLKKYNYSYKIGLGNAGGFLNEDSWIIFVRNDLLASNLINGEKLTATKGIYIFIAFSGYFSDDKHIQLSFGFPQGDMNLSRCSAIDQMDRSGKLQYFDFKYKDLEKEANQIVKDFQDMINYFNIFDKKDFKLRAEFSTFIPLNQILYGPPGTGKTYHTIDKALEILGENLESRDEKKAKFDEYVKNGQIVFTTFHQSYGYEEFVEGIKPRIDSEENSKEIKYEIKDGIFKELCEKALENRDSIKNFNFYIDKLKEKAKIDDNNPEKYFELPNTKYSIQYRNGKTFRIKFDDMSKNHKDYPVSIDNIEKLYKTSNIDEIYNSVYVRAILNYLKSQGLEDYKEKDEKTNLPYIIIIDEINRGNVSKIFGELITLIEPSKRIGEKEELKVILPYSKKEFGVPKNVYIIGTMNTADRSITSLDTALRRRFEFIEMMPDVSKLSMDCEGINLQELLKAINTRIEYLLDREKTIGHAFFIGVENLNDLKSIFQNKIIPLLQEYFYNDYALINAVLNDNGMIFEDKKDDKYLQKIKNLDSVNSERSIYNIASFDDKIWDKIEIYQAIYNDEIANKLKNENE
ncbi:McrB family protein [Campylobacter jejuni]|uniref:McrB family protein n=1 Tax=Campylobacter jejuni TaxID=197 RepID=UPI0011A5C2B2|nr:AAA family ATPase [Campylobacter jejuni]